MSLEKDNTQYITFVSSTVCKFVFTFMPSEDEEQQSVQSRRDLQLHNFTDPVERKLSETVWWSGRDRSLELDLLYWT